MWALQKYVFGVSDMTVRFLGVRQTKKSGCSVCGKRSTGGATKVERDKRITMPSGMVKKFFINSTYEVSDSDGAFLLSLTYNHKGTSVHMFEVV